MVLSQFKKFFSKVKYNTNWLLNDILKVPHILLSMIFSFIIFLLLHHYIHEIGHLISGYLFWLFSPETTLPKIINWEFLLNVIPIPQRTEAMKNSIVALSGPLFTILSSFVLFIYLHKKNKIKLHKTIGFWALIFFYEVFGNIIYGTDNITQKPLNIVKPTAISWFLKYFILLVAVYIFIFFFKDIKVIVERIKKDFKKCWKKIVEWFQKD